MERSSKGGMRLDDPRKIFTFTLFTTITNVVPKDYFEVDFIISFLVEPSDFRKLKNKLGTSVKMLSQELGKPIEIVIYSDSLEQFIKNLVRPAQVERIAIRETEGNKKAVFIKVPPWDRGKALGKNSYKLQRLRFFLDKYFNISNVRIL